MRAKVCSVVCIHCGETENVTYKNKNQCYCKTCNKYFKPDSTRAEFSRKSILLMNTIVNLFSPCFKERQLTLRTFQKKIDKRPAPLNRYNQELIYKIMPN